MASKYSGVILPSIEMLAEKIEAAAKLPSEQVTALRETCRRKLRKYRQAQYLARFEIPAEVEAAKVRWSVVEAFAEDGAARPATDP